MSSRSNIHVVTGAFGYSGKYIAAKLIQKAIHVRTLTNSPNRMNPFREKIETYPYSFDNFEHLVLSLKDVTTLYNTYWVRFNHPHFKFSFAVENTLRLIEAAKKAGVERFVHVSITNPSLDSPLELFKGKAILEKALIESGLSYAILRPTVIFGKEDILINNIAWVLRKFPFFGIFGNGEYKLQPIYVEDLADIAVKQGESQGNTIIDAVGPETYSYKELVQTIGAIIGEQRKIVPLPPNIAYLFGWMISQVVGDVTITRDEIRGLMGNLLVTESQPSGSTKLSEWIKENAATLGVKYNSELARRMNRSDSYENL